MGEAYISLEKAANYEYVDYDTLKKRIQRGTAHYKTKTETGNSGRDRVLIAISSLSDNARKLYYADKKQQLDPVAEVLQNKEQEEPWYISTDPHWYMENYKGQYHKALELAKIIVEWQNYTGDFRTLYTR